MHTQPAIDVAELPEATAYLNYPKRGPEVGRYLGPNQMGEYFTVVSNDEWQEFTKGAKSRIYHRVGLAYGCYTIGGEPTDPAGLPTDVVLAQLAKLQAAEMRDWIAQPPPPKPLILPRGLVMPVVNEPDAYLKVTDA